VRGFLLQADGLLRGMPGPETASPGRSVVRFMGFVVVFGMFYGAVMGSYGGIFGERFVQAIYSATKVPLLLLVTFLITLPSFFVLNTLLGLRADFGRAVQALVATQAGLTIILASLAPLTAFWYFCTADYNLAVLFNGLMFALASISAQWILRRRYRELIARNGRHRTMMRTWLVIYAFVGIQLGWILRPFIGSPEIAPQFLRSEAWGNAYVVVARVFWQAVSP